MGWGVQRQAAQSFKMDEYKNITFKFFSHSASGTATGRNLDSHPSSKNVSAVNSVTRPTKIIPILAIIPVVYIIDFLKEFS